MHAYASIWRHMHAYARRLIDFPLILYVFLTQGRGGYPRGEGGLRPVTRAHIYIYVYVVANAVAK